MDKQADEKTSMRRRFELAATLGLRLPTHCVPASGLKSYGFDAGPGYP